MRTPLTSYAQKLAVLILLLILALIPILVLTLILVLILTALLILRVLVLAIRVTILVLVVLIVIIRHICDLLTGFLVTGVVCLFFTKICFLIYGTLEPIFILHFCDISTIIINVNRRTLHDSICTLMYYLFILPSKEPSASP